MANTPQGTKYEVIAPDGTVGTVSEANRSKVGAGYKLTGRVEMHAPDGTRGFVAPEHMREAIEAKYQTTPKTRMEKSATEGPRGVWNTLKGMVPPNPTGGHSPFESKFWWDNDKSKFDPKGKGTAYDAATRPLPPDIPGVTGRGGDWMGRAIYRTAGALAPLAGGSAENMEEASSRGDTSGVATQAAVPIAAAVGAAGLKASMPWIKGKVGAAMDAYHSKMTPVEGEYGQSAIAQKGFKPGKGDEQQFQRDVKEGGRAYLSGSKNMAGVQAKIPGAKTEIWADYKKGMDKFGNQPVTGPDGKPTTYAALEARRLKVSAQLDAVRSMTPAEKQTAMQQGLHEADLAAENKALSEPIDKRFAQEGIDAPLIRATHGHVKGIERTISGQNTLSEEPKPYGLGKMAQADIRRPITIIPAIGEGLSDIVQGKPWWKGKPTDVNIRQGLRTGADKPNFRLPPEKPPAPSLASKLFKGPSGPAEQVDTTGPGGGKAVFPDQPSGQAPQATTTGPTAATGSQVGGEFPNWPPGSTGGWGPEPQQGGSWFPSTKPPIPTGASDVSEGIAPGEAASTATNVQPHPYDAPSSTSQPWAQKGPQPLPAGVTPDQYGALPTNLRNSLSNLPPKPGSYSPGASADVATSGAPLPSSTSPISTTSPAAPPTMPSLADVTAANKPTNLGAGLPSEGIVGRTPPTDNTPLGADTTVKFPPSTMPPLPEPTPAGRIGPGVRRQQAAARNNAATMRSGGTYDESTTPPRTTNSDNPPPTPNISDPTNRRADTPPTPKVRDMAALRAEPPTTGFRAGTANPTYNGPERRSGRPFPPPTPPAAEPDVPGGETDIDQALRRAPFPNQFPPTKPPIPPGTQ